MDQLQKQILESFEIDETLLPAALPEDDQFKALRQLLVQRIEELAEKDMEKLLWALYRIDVSEKKLTETLKTTPPEHFATTIADMIIERQMQKIQTRKQFGDKENDWNFDI
jgi:hypothetical protein